MKAAQHEGIDRFSSAAPHMIATGGARWAFTDNTRTAWSDPSQVRGVARQVMTALGAGVRSLCPHTTLIRPLLLICDPPLLACFECIRTRKADVMAVSREIGHLWNYQCDRCGAQTELLSASTVSGFGPLTITGHSATRASPKISSEQLSLPTRSYLYNGATGSPRHDQEGGGGERVRDDPTAAGYLPGRAGQHER